MKNLAAYKLNLQMYKSQLIFKCMEVGLETSGTKAELAERLTEYEQKEMERYWLLMV